MVFRVAGASLTSAFDVFFSWSWFRNRYLINLRRYLFLFGSWCRFRSWLAFSLSCSTNLVIRCALKLLQLMRNGSTERPSSWAFATTTQPFYATSFAISYNRFFDTWCHSYSLVHKSPHFLRKSSIFGIRFLGLPIAMPIPSAVKHCGDFYIIVVTFISRLFDHVTACCTCHHLQTAPSASMSLARKTDLLPAIWLITICKLYYYYIPCM